MSSPLLNTLLVVVACGGGHCVPAQTATIDLPDPALAERPQVVVLSGISTEGGGDGAFQSFFLSAECPVGAYQHVGLQYGTYLPDENNYYVSLREGGYEIGLFSKFFLHGRLSGRRSHLYYGPQLRFGVRKMTYGRTFNSIFPGNNAPYDYQVNTTKVLLCLGGQYTLGHGVFEWSLPVGVEYERSNLPASIDQYGFGSGNRRHFILLPGIALGFRL